MHARQRWRRTVAPRWSAILADVISCAEHATAKCRLPCCDSALPFFFGGFFSLFLFYSLLPHLSSVECALRSERVGLFFSLFPRRTRIVDDSRVQTFAFRLRNEARHPLPGTRKMAEFNGKAPIRAIRCSDYGMKREAGPLILITLISLPLLWRNCGRISISIDSQVRDEVSMPWRKNRTGFIARAARDFSVSRYRKTNATTDRL